MVRLKSYTVLKNFLWFTATMNIIMVTAANFTTDFPEVPEYAWSGWSSWSPCSRSCGGGVSVQERHCLPRNSVNGTVPGVRVSRQTHECVGVDKRYQECNTKPCIVGEGDMRAAQCSSYDRRPFRGRFYTWVPYVDGVSPCMLNCRPLGQHFYASLSLVADGTPCTRPGHRAMCIQGTCQGPLSARKDEGAAKAVKKKGGAKKRVDPKPAHLTAPARDCSSEEVTLSTEDTDPALRESVRRLDEVLAGLPSRFRRTGFDREISYSSGSNMSLDDVGRPAPTGRRTPIKRRLLAEDEAGPSTSKETAPKPKRGRGRPPTTGRYVGYAKAQTKYRQKEEALRLEAEEEVAEAAQRARRTWKDTSSALAALPASSPAREEALETAGADLAKTVEQALETIEMVGKNSANLKGTFQKYLRESVSTIAMVFDEMRSRSSSEEIQRLEARNARLEKQVAVLRQELDEMRKQGSQPAGDGSLRELLAEVSRANVETFGNMLNARLAGLEDRLLPEPRRRPPLASDGKAKAKKAQPPVAAAAPQEAPAASTPPKGKKARKKKKKRLSMAAQEAAQGGVNTSSPRTETPWTTVGPKGKKKKGAATPSTAAPKKKKKRKLRPLKSAAITLTLEKGVDQRVTYASILEDAKSRIDLAEVGICQGNKVRFRLARTGARILEIIGEDAQKKADALANRMRDVLDRDVVRIDRPVNRAELLVSGMDDAATAADVTKAAAKAGGCPATDIRSGRITVGPRGARSLWLHVPTAAAKKLVASGRLQVGWVMTKVVLLAARPTRCYRCLDVGHLASNCQSPVDRSRNCFRCGKPGHKAADCVEKPSCFFCAELGKESNHVLGANGCITAASKPPGTRKKRKAPSKAQPRKRPGADKAGASEVAPAMEVEA